MNRETIERAAMETARKACAHYDEAFEYANGFVIGAHWRINSVWHTDVKAGNTRRAILVRFNNGLFNVFEDIRDLKGIEDLVWKFAYLDDLLPDGKEDGR